jgi:hypothetical protein
LALNTRNGTPQAKTYVGGTPTNVANTFGAANNNTGTTANNWLDRSAIINFGGYQTFVAVAADKIYQSTDGGTTWTAVRTLTNLAATIQSAKTGFWVLHPSGTPTLCIGYQKSATDWCVEKSTDGATWTTVGPTTLTSNGSNPICDVAVWAGRLWWTTNNGSGTQVTIVYNASAASLTSFTLAGLSSTSTGIGALSPLSSEGGGGLFGLFIDSGNTAKLYVVNSVSASLTWTLLCSVASSVAQNAQVRWALFRDAGTVASQPSSTYLVWASLKALIQTASGVWNCYAFSFPNTSSSISTAGQGAPVAGATSWSSILLTGVVPTGINSSTGRVVVVVDPYQVPWSDFGSVKTAAYTGYITVNNLAPGQVYVLYAPDGATGSTWTCYQVANEAATSTTWATRGSAGGSAADAVPTPNFPSGSYFWQTGQIKVEFTGVAWIAGGYRLSFKLYSASGTDTCAVRVWRDFDNGPTWINILNPSAGSLYSNPTFAGGNDVYRFNEVQSLTADGTTTYTVDTAYYVAWRLKLWIQVLRTSSTDASSFDGYTWADQGLSSAADLGQDFSQPATGVFGPPVSLVLPPYTPTSVFGPPVSALLDRTSLTYAFGAPVFGIAAAIPTINIGLPTFVTTAGTPKSGIDGPQLADAGLSADIPGRSRMATDFLNTETLRDKVVANAIGPKLFRKGKPIHVGSQSFDATITGLTKILTLLADFVPTAVRVRNITATSITVVATIDVRSATAGDVMAATALNGLTSTTQMLPFKLSGTTPAILAAGADIYVNVATAATATAQVCIVDLFGYYVPDGQVDQ